jgi:hypothetical protein
VNANASFGDFNNSNSNPSFNTSNASLSQRHATSNKMTMTTTPPSFVHADPYPSANTPKPALTTPVLRKVSVNPNLARGNAPSIEAFKPFSPLVLEGVVGSDSAVKVKVNHGANANANNNTNTTRPRVGSTARRTALGWSKRSSGPAAAAAGGNGGVRKSSTTMSTDQKENSIVVAGSGNGSGGIMMTCVIFSFLFF